MLTIGQSGNYSIKLIGEETAVCTSSSFPSIPSKDRQIVARILAFLYNRDYGNLYLMSDVFEKVFDVVIEKIHKSFDPKFPRYADSETPGSTPTLMSETGSDEGDEIYHKLDAGPFLENPGRCSLVIHTKVYIAAGRYGISPLQNLAKHKFQRALAKENWVGDDLIQVLKLLYNETETSTKPLREIAIHVASAHMQQGLRDHDFLDLLKYNGEISVDILKVLAVEKSRQSGRSDWNYQRQWEKF